MKNGWIAVALSVALAGCASGTGTIAPRTSAPPAPSEPSPTPTIQDVTELEFGDGEFPTLEPGTYSIDPDADPSTPLRVVYEVPVEGWSSWIGAAKFSDDGQVGTAPISAMLVSITSVTNLVRHGCRDHSPADPPVGPSADDLATALADLAPFRVTSPSKDVTIYGYSGKHLKLTVPDLPVRGDPADLRFIGCVDGDLHSWISPPNEGAFFGYEGPGYREEFWILDVEGTRLMIVAHRSAGAPREDLPELRAILDSIRIEP